MQTLLFLLIAYLGSQIGLLLRLPAGALLGALMAVAIVNSSIYEFTQVFTGLNVLAKIMLGITLGLLFDRSVLKMPKSYVFWFILLGFGNVLIAVSLGHIFFRIGLFSEVTGMIATAPGGFAEMLALSEATESPAYVTVTFHLLRVIFIMLFFKWVIHRYA